MPRRRALSERLNRRHVRSRSLRIVMLRSGMLPSGIFSSVKPRRLGLSGKLLQSVRRAPARQVQRDQRREERKDERDKKQ